MGGGSTLRLPGIAILALCALAACSTPTPRPVDRLAALDCHRLAEIADDHRDAAKRAKVVAAGETTGAVTTAGLTVAGVVNPWFAVGYAAAWSVGKLTGFLDSDAGGHEAEARTVETVKVVKTIVGQCDRQIAEAQQ